MTKRSLSLYTKDILESIEKIEEFIEGMDFDKFQSDDRTSSAVLRKLEIIGEAVKQLPDEIRDSYKKIPWKEMAGMRDKLIHWYFGVMKGGTGEFFFIFQWFHNPQKIIIP